MEKKGRSRTSQHNGGCAAGCWRYRRLMWWRYREPEPPPDPHLDPYRRGAARVFDGDRLAGNLVTRVEVWWTTEGPWWRRRDVRHVERVGGLITFGLTFEFGL